MGLPKGRTNNPRGRVRGKGNKSTESLRNVVQSLLERNLEQIQRDFDKLKPFERITAFDRLLRHVLPSMQSVQMDLDINNLSDEQVNMIVDELLKNERK